MALVVGLTGIIGSGKTACAEILQKWGATILDADVFARECVATGTAELSAIVQRFSPEILTTDGQLNRQKLGEIVFTNERARGDLEAIVHPCVRKKTRAGIDRAQKDPSTQLIVCVIPLLFESTTPFSFLDATVLVVASEAQCLQRIMLRDNSSADAAQKRIATQLPVTEKIKQATYVIGNDSSLQELEKKVRLLWNTLTTQPAL